MNRSGAVYDLPKLVTRAEKRNRAVPSLILALVVSTLAACQADTAALVLVDDRQQATIYLPKSASEPIRRAVDDLRSDIEQISDQRLLVTDQPDSSATQILVYNLADEAQAEEALALNPNLDTLSGQWEAYVVQNILVNRTPHLMIAGSDERATMFAIYHFIEEYLGVDPMYYWSDLEPEKKEQLAWDEVRIVQNEPTFTFRGGFINDEDLLTEWENSGGERDIDYRFYSQVVHPDVIQRVLETMLRLRLNLIIPASFVDIRNPPEERLVAEAAKRGLFVSMHHIEPMGVSAFAYQNYWRKRGEEPMFSFYSEREKIIQTWQEYARRWAKYPNVIWQVGLRGIADRPMWMADPGVPQSDAERGAIISEAIRVQSEIIDTLVQNPILSTTLWAEGASLNEQGLLTFPDSVIVVFADNSPGWKWQPDFYQTERNPANAYGVYYHHQLWNSGPHLVQGVPPAKTYAMFQEALDHDASEYAIMNISNLREFVLGVEASAEMLYDMDAYSPDTFMHDWFKQRFGDARETVQAAYQAFFDSYRIHPQTNTPLLLDGQTRSYGLNLLNRLKMQLTEPERYRQMLEKESEKSVEQRWAATSLSDMHPANSMPPDTLLPILTQQIERLEAAGNRIAEAEQQIEKGATKNPSTEAPRRVSTSALQFFRANLLAQHQMLLGLNRWLEAVILARFAADEGNKQAMETHLQRALQHLQQVQAAQAIASEGEKWQHWYRGDRKMNIAEMIARTDAMLRVFNGRSKPRSPA